MSDRALVRKSISAMMRLETKYTNIDYFALYKFGHPAGNVIRVHPQWWYYYKPRHDVNFARINIHDMKIYESLYVIIKKDETIRRIWYVNQMDELCADVHGVIKHIVVV